MLVAIYARSTSEDDVSRQVESCRRYVVEKWQSKTRLKLFTEIVEGLQNLENCAELQKLITESKDLDAVVVAHPLCFFPHLMDESIAIYKMIGGRKIHYATNHQPMINKKIISDKNNNPRSFQSYFLLLNCHSQMYFIPIL